MENRHGVHAIALRLPPFRHAIYPDSGIAPVAAHPYAGFNDAP